MFERSPFIAKETPTFIGLKGQAVLSTLSQEINEEDEIAQPLPSDSSSTLTIGFSGMHAGVQESRP